MGATGMTVSETSKRMWDSSGEISDRAQVTVWDPGATSSS